MYVRAPIVKTKPGTHSAAGKRRVSRDSFCSFSRIGSGSVSDWPTILKLTAADGRVTGMATIRSYPEPVAPLSKIVPSKSFLDPGKRRARCVGVQISRSQKPHEGAAKKHDRNHPERHIHVVPISDQADYKGREHVSKCMDD